MDARREEIRSIEGCLCVREQEEGQAGQSRTITGRAIVFNSESELLDEDGVRFKEVVLPGALSEEFLSTQDIKLNMLHDRCQTVARCNKGKGNLRLELREDGLWFEFDAPRCDIGDRCLELVRAGVFSGCSFEFYPGDYDIEETVGGVMVRHKSFSRLAALTIGMDPAYQATSVSVRELVKVSEVASADDAAAVERETLSSDEENEVADREAMEKEMWRRYEVLKKYNY